MTACFASVRCPSCVRPLLTLPVRASRSVRIWRPNVIKLCAEIEASGGVSKAGDSATLVVSGAAAAAK